MPDSVSNIPMTVVGKGVVTGYLAADEVAGIVRAGLAPMPLDGRRVLVLIPDGTRTMPMPLMFDTLERELLPRAAALDYLVALGTHTPMDDARLAAHVGRSVVDGRAGRSRIFNHNWSDPATFAHLGTIPASEIADLTNGRLREDVPVALNRLATEYDHVLICGPVFPHEVAGFSGGAKYLFPGIAAPGDHSLHPLARRAHHEPRDDWDDRHARARGHPSRRGAARPADLRSWRPSSRTRASRECSAAI